MPLISSTEMLQAARRDKYAVAAFNVHTLEMLQAVVEAAVEMDSPLIIQSTVGTVKHLGADYLAHAAKTAADRTGLPMALHLDHCTDFPTIIQCIRAGYTSVMIDASMFPFEENVERTSKVMEIAKASGVNVEAGSARSAVSRMTLSSMSGKRRWPIPKNARCSSNAPAYLR